MEQVATLPPSTVDAALWAAAARVDAEAGGVLSLNVVRPCDMPALNAEIAAGNLRTAIAVGGACALMQRMATCSGDTAPHCPGCDRPITAGVFSFVAAVAFDAPTDCLTAVVCGDCATEPNDLRQVAAKAFRRVWADFRLLPPIHPTPGHA